MGPERSSQSSQLRRDGVRRGIGDRDLGSLRAVSERSPCCYSCRCGALVLVVAGELYPIRPPRTTPRTSPLLRHSCSPRCCWPGRRSVDRSVRASLLSDFYRESRGGRRRSTSRSTLFDSGSLARRRRYRARPSLPPTVSRDSPLTIPSSPRLRSGRHLLRPSTTRSSVAARDRAGGSRRQELRNNLGFHTATTMVLIAQGPLIAWPRREASCGCCCSFPASLPVVPNGRRISSAKEQLATHASLTGLPNRLWFRDRLGSLISEGREGGSLV